MSRCLHVTLGMARLGDLRQERTGRIAWEPDVSWLKSGQLPRLGAAFLREPRPPPSGTDLLPWFDNLLPEMDSPLRQRLCAGFGLRQTQSFALLAALGADLPGAAVLRAPSAADVAMDEPPSEGAPLASPSTFRWSALAGMQLKLSMSMIKDSLCLPATGVDGDWIVKFPGSHFEELPEVEHATMAWAAAAGFDVPEHRVVAASDLEGIDASWCEGSPTVYAIRRFDRSPGRRIHMEDFCQALALPPRYKYDGAGGGPVSFEGALLFATDLCGQEAGREMARRLGFVIASGNSDAHLKNWSIVWNDEGAAHLAPLYDQVATIAWETMGWSLRGGPNLALRIVGEARLRMLDATNLRHLGQRTGLSWAPDEVMNGVEASARAWSAVANGAPARLRNALVQHWKEVPLLRRWGSLPE